MRIYILECRVKDADSGLLRQNLQETLKPSIMHKYEYIYLYRLKLSYIYSYIWLLQRQLEVPFILYAILLKC